MVAFTSLTTALKGHFHKSLASLPPDIQQRILEDFYPWSWEGKSPRERCHVAKRWDDEHDPAHREVREGIEALTNPDSPAYSPEETQRLRGDFLPEPRNVHPIVVLPPIEWDEPQLSSKQRAPSTAKESAEARALRLLQAFGEEVRASGKYGAVARVHARELVFNPKADRSSIGKQIKQAQVGKDKETQGAAMYDSLRVKDGKRVT